MGLILFLTAASHLFYTPFTKVEESFNLQAMHDILYLKHNFSQYDHHDYPGVVPRTFLGPLFISIVSSPFVIFIQSLGIPKYWSQYVVRLAIAGTVAYSWEHLRTVVRKTFGINVSIWYTLITISQFHFVFYMSRPLPNIMALPLVLYAISAWMKDENKKFICSSGIAIIVFRSELAAFLGLLLAFDLYVKKISTTRLLKIAIPTAVIILVTTILLDSFFWNRLVWPEGEVLWYNTILNKSSDWGTSPFLWYFYSAIPRAMGLSLIFIPIGIYLEPRLRTICLSALIFVLLYSVLPHKELRFIIYIFPVLNISAACACHRAWINRTKSTWQGFLAFIAGGHIAANVILTLFLLVVSSTNYPGGVALSRLHRLTGTEANLNATVHISNLAAQSGVSRFLQINSNWQYSKKENLKYNNTEFLKFDYLLVEAKSKLTEDWDILQENYESMEFVDCFSNIAIQYKSVLPVRVKTKPCIGLMKKRNIPRVRAENIDYAKLKSEITNKLESARVPVKEPQSSEQSQSNEYIAENVKDIVIENVKETKNLEEKNDESSTNNRSSEEEEEEELHLKKDNLEVLKANNNKAAKIQREEIKNVGYSPKGDLNVKKPLRYMREAIEKDNDVKPLSIEDDDGILISSMDGSSEDSEESDVNSQTKDINFDELRNLAIGKITKTTKAKLREIIEQHYRSKGSIIETDKPVNKKVGPVKLTIKTIIKQEKIKEMIDAIAKMDLTKYCNLDILSTKECLKIVIDKIDDESK